MAKTRNPKVAIYKITSKSKGKCYVGSSVDVLQRWRKHRVELKSNYHHSNYLQNHYNKYGMEDLDFSILEELTGDNHKSTADFKTFILQREQYYIDTLKPEFNSTPNAGNCLGNKVEGSKYYSHIKSEDSYVVQYRVKGKLIHFNKHKNEVDAIKQVDYIKSLTEDEIINYYETHIKGSGGFKEGYIRKDANYYYKVSKNNKWVVCLKIKQLSRKVQFGSFDEETNAKELAEHLSSLSKDDLYQYYLDNVKSKIKNYCFDKDSGKYAVYFSKNGKTVAYGRYNTEQEAKDKVEQVKLALLTT